MAMSDLKDAFDGALPMKEAIKEYEYQCGKNLFYVSRTEDEGKQLAVIPRNSTEQIQISVKSYKSKFFGTEIKIRGTKRSPLL